VDNLTLDILAVGAESLRDALAIAFRHNAAGDHATHWAVLDLPFKGVEYCGDANPTRKTLVLFWSEPNDKRIQDYPFPAQATKEDAIVFVQSWLHGLCWPEEPDHDGDNEKGFRMFVEDWGHVVENGYAICAIQPAWAMYGK